MKKIIRRALTVIPIAALQALWIVLLMKWLAPYTALVSLALSVAAFLFVLYIIIKRDESTYKILWLLIILTFPIPGSVLYALFGNKRMGRPLAKRLRRVEESGDPVPLATGGTPFDGGRRIEQTFRWLEKKTGYPLTEVEHARYYPLGDEMFPDMLADIRAARAFIYLEYFIVTPGVFWGTIVEALEEKVRQGVDVRVMYDDLGSISTFNLANAMELQKKGIPCVPFNPIIAVKGTLNYRDHRKMLIIDGEIAYTGGVNLADEYINRIVRFGHWKDTGVRLTGAPARSYLHMFLTFWNAFSGQSAPMTLLLPDRTRAPEPKDGGYVLSYYDSPLNREATTNQLYIDLLSQSTEYAWFFTPYLMPGDDLTDALVSAAHRGVDVRILMPGIPDKKLIFRMSHSFYQVLLTEGVKIYEYAPGFIHAKGFLSDDIVGAVGTVNLDYRSLFLHFENNSLFYRAPLLADLKADFLATQEKCVQIQPLEAKKYSLRWIVDGILRIFAPLC